MFKIKTDEEIGEYLDYLIRKNYPSVRKFCQDYLRLDKRPVNDDETRKMANRMSQIIKGAKSIQTYDLPFFTELLGVTCEQILSAGECCLQKIQRTTNYSIAFSKNKNEWKKYIKREDKLILNPDEYDKTVIDYAIEARNYDLIKYLMDKNYIWLVSDKQTDFSGTFGAGTSIERRQFGYHDMLQYRLETKDNLRMDIIALAVENNDIDALEKLKAREIPIFYHIVKYVNWKPFDTGSRYDASRLVKVIANASDKMIEYFITPFEVIGEEKDSKAHSHTFVFPFYSELLTELIKRNHKYTELALKTAIDHNRNTYEQLKSQIETASDTYGALYGNKEFLFNTAKDVDFYKKLHILCFTEWVCNNSTKTNIVYLSLPQKCANDNVKILINELNSLYEKVVNIKDEYDISNNKY